MKELNKKAALEQINKARRIASLKPLKMEDLNRTALGVKKQKKEGLKRKSSRILTKKDREKIILHKPGGLKLTWKMMEKNLFRSKKR